jgi:hypothetical protein
VHAFFLRALRYASEDEVVADALERLRRQTPPPAVGVAAVTEEQFKHRLLESGLMTNLPTPADPASRPHFEPIALEGEPLSETIARERR